MPLTNKANYKLTLCIMFKVWSDLMAVEFVIPEATALWQDRLKESFTKRLNKVGVLV